MDWRTLLIIVVQIVIPLILFFLIKNYFPAYFTEKGKNLATKEDIGEITREIKTVESKINIRASSEIDYNSLKRKTVLEYFGAYNNMETLLLSSHSNYDDNCKVKNDALVDKLNDAKFNFSLKEGEAELFIAEQEFLEQRKKVNNEIFELLHEFEMHCSDINFIVLTEPVLSSRHQKIRDSKADFHQKRLNILGNIIPLRVNLINYLENVLKQSFH